MFAKDLSYGHQIFYDPAVGGCLFESGSQHPYAIRVYSGKTRIDQIQLPSGKQYHLCSIPYYLVSRLEDVIERFVSEGGRS